MLHADPTHRSEADKCLQAVDSLLQKVQCLPETRTTQRRRSPSPCYMPEQTLNETRKVFALKDKLLSQRQISDKVQYQHGHPKRPHALLYKSDNEALGEVYRYIMFDDIEGLKKRAVEIQQERNKCEKLLNCQKDEINDLRHQLNLRDDLI